MNQPLTYMDGETLMNTLLPPIRFVISQLLPQGLHVLAGAPKVGKSWLSLWLCLQVAKGKPAWEFPTTQGDVLYLCLEDSYSRIQNRLLDITDDAPPNLFFSTMSEKLHNGLEQQIERFLTSHPDTALIVIDTLQRIRGGVNDANPYASDYRDLGIEELKEKNLPSAVHPTAEEWDNLLTILGALYRLMAAQADGMANPSCPAMEELLAQTEALVRETAAICQLLERRERAGRKKERWRLPQVTLPRPRPAWLWAIPILLGLWVMWYSGAAIWNNLLMPLAKLPR